MGMCLRQTMQMQMQLQMRLVQRLELAQKLELRMEQLTKEEMEELAKHGLLNSDIPDPLRVRVNNLKGRDIVMKEFRTSRKDAYREAANMRKMGELGFGTPKVTGIAEKGTETYLISDFIPDAVNLKAILKNPFVLMQNCGPENKPFSDDGDHLSEMLARKIYELGAEIAAMHEKGVIKESPDVSNILLTHDGFVHTGCAEVRFEGRPLNKTESAENLSQLLEGLNTGALRKYEKEMKRLFLRGYLGKKMRGAKELADAIKKDKVFVMEKSADAPRRMELHEYLSAQREHTKAVENAVRKAVLECEEFDANSVFAAATREYKAGMDLTREDVSKEALNGLVYAVEGMGIEYNITYADVAFRACMNPFAVDEEDEDDIRMMNKLNRNSYEYDQKCREVAHKLGVPPIESFRAVFENGIVERACIELPDWTLVSMREYLKERGFKFSVARLKEVLERVATYNIFAELDQKTRLVLIRYVDAVLAGNGYLDMENVLAQMDGEKKKNTARRFLKKLVRLRLAKEMLRHAHDGVEPDIEDFAMRFEIDAQELRKMYLECGGVFEGIRGRVADVMEEVGGSEDEGAREAEAADQEGGREEEVEEAEVPEAMPQAAVEFQTQPVDQPQPQAEVRQPQAETVDEGTRRLMDYVLTLMQENSCLTDQQLGERMGVSSEDAGWLVNRIIEERGLCERKDEVLRLVKARFGCTDEQLSQTTGLSVADIKLILREEILSGRLFEERGVVPGGAETGNAHDGNAHGGDAHGGDAHAGNAHGGDENERKTVLSNLIDKRVDISDRELADNLNTDPEVIRRWITRLMEEQRLTADDYRRLNELIMRHPGIDDDGIANRTGLSRLKIHLILRRDFMNGALRGGRPGQGMRED